VKAPTRATPGSSIRSDGTTNFSTAFRSSRFRSGLQRENVLMAGVIYNPANDELYIPSGAKAAFLNDQRLRVAGRKNLSDSVIACGLPHIGRGDLRLAQTELAEMMPKGRRAAPLWRPGLARPCPRSLRAVSTAIGSANLQPWDLAAGILMVREAGGTVSGMLGNDDPLTTGKRDLWQRGHTPRAREGAQVAGF